MEDAAAEVVSERIQEAATEAAPEEEPGPVRQQEASESATGEPASEGAPLQGVHAAVAPGECGAQGGYRRSRGLPPSLSHHKQPGVGSLDSPAELAAWRRQQRRDSWWQLKVPERSAADAIQSVTAERAGQGGEVEGAGVEKEDLPPVHHKA